MAAITLFSEVQDLPQKWIWAVMLLINGLLLFSFFYIFFYTYEDKEEKTLLVLMAVSLTAVITVILKNFRLITHIKSDGIYIRFAPFYTSPVYIGLDDIVHTSVRRYNPLVEYGGWGIRYRKEGTAYSVSGDTGIELLLANGRKIMIGTKAPYAAAEALQKLGLIK